MGGFFGTLPSVINQGVIWGIMAIGIFITFKILDFADLSVDGSFATGGCVFCVLVGAGVNVPIALLLALVAGSLAGLITAVLHCYLGIPGILSGILTQLMLYSINFTILGQTMKPISNRGSLISSEMSVGVYTTLPIVFGIAAVVIIALYWFFGTQFGATIRSTGANHHMSKANGININTRKITALMISNGIVAFAGALFSQYQGGTAVNIGQGAIVIGLAAIIIGTSIIKKFSTNFAVQLSFTIVGAIIYFFVYQLVNYFLHQPELLKIISAVVVVIFLAIPYVKETYFKKFKSKISRGKELE